MKRPRRASIRSAARRSMDARMRAGVAFHENAWRAAISIAARASAGEASRTVYVPLTNDAVREPAKSFRVLVGRGEGADIAADMRLDLVDDE